MSLFIVVACGLVGFLVVWKIFDWRDSRINGGRGTTPGKGDTANYGSQQHQWFDILGVPEGASVDEVRAAYREKIRMYHPDRVAGLGPEFAVTAERKTKELNAAYAYATKRKT